MSTTTNLGLVKLEENQYQPHVLVNEAMDSFDDYLGRLTATATKTTAYTITKSDGVILCNHTAGMAITLPGVTAGVIPRAGQRWLIKDRSSAGAGTYNITISSTGSIKLDGVAAGSVVLAGDRAWCEIEFDGTDYWVVRAKGVLTPNDLLSSWGSLVGMENNGVNSAIIPASNATPTYLPFMFAQDVSVDAVVYPFGTQSPTPDSTTARVRLCFMESLTTFLPGAIRFASEDFVLQGGAHIRTTPLGYGNMGAVVSSVAICALSARRYFKGNTLYFLGLHYENTFAGSPTTIDAGRGIGYNAVKLNAGAQAWGYTFTGSPTVSAQFSADDELRANVLLRFRRMADIY